MLNENQHKLLNSDKVQMLIKALDAEPVDFDHSKRAAVHQRVESWFSELDKKYNGNNNSRPA